MNSICSHERLELALAGLLNAEDESMLHLHLDECELCSVELERLAGGESASKEIASMLIPDDLDDALPLREEWSTADFVVEHLVPSDDPAVLGRLGSYDVLELIGRGGMGVVLKGYDRELKRFVAIKALAPHLAHSALARKRFAREAQAAAAVVNLHVIAIHQVQPNGPLPFLVMPLLTGESLAQRMTARGALELRETLRIGMQAAEGLAAAHGQGLIHRDVKPANILLEKGVERAVLTDFGLARAADDVSMTRWGIIAGTPEYMSPEQARGEVLDGRSDLFSLGCVMYEMATGVSPFRADSTMATLRRIVDEKPAAMASHTPELPPWFIRIVERLLSKDPAQRFASASEVRELLEQCLSHLQQPTSVPLPASTVLHGASRHSIFTARRIGVVAMLGASGFAFLWMMLWQAFEAPDISGQWSSEEWGTVVLKSKQPHQYEGTFTADQRKPGSVNLKWSRVEHRFNGTWGKNDDIGHISVRLVGDEIRGTWSVGDNTAKDSGLNRLFDLAWTRSGEFADTEEWNDIDRKEATTRIRSYFPGMTQEIADAILDWVDEDDESRPFGAESQTYRQLDSPYSPSNRPLTHMEELLCIRGVTPKLVYGADTNRNGTIDGGEIDSSDKALGWAGIIRGKQTESSAQARAAQSDVDRILFALVRDNPRVNKFAELDTDHDGRLSMAEFGVGRKAKYGAKWFGLRDADHDGFLSPAEFVPLSASGVQKPAGQGGASHYGAFPC